MPAYSLSIVTVAVSAAVCQIFSVKEWRDLSPSGILKICSFCQVAFVGMPFCFLIQNIADAEIGQSVDELWPKKRFLRWQRLPS